MTRKAYEPVTRYRTADGVVHDTEQKAQEHAEDKAGREIDVLLHAADPNIGSQLSYRLICHMLKNHEQYAAAFAGLHAFDETPE